MKKLLIAIMFLLPKLLLSQVLENFSDGDFLKNPAWSGDTAKWQVINGQLQSNGPALTPTILYISTPSSLAYNCQWEFFVNPKLSTSSGNYLDVFLIADQANLNSNLNGYLVRIGGTKDEICLYKKNGALTTKLIDGADKSIASSSSNPFKIKVIRDKNYKWTLETDKTAGNLNYELQGNCIDSQFTTSTFCGILVKYSASNAKKFLFDDFYIGPIIIDSIAPQITEIKLINSYELDVCFSEAISQSTAENIFNYFEKNGIGHPVEANRDNSNAALVHLSFSNPFSSGITDSICIKNICDLAGNSMTDDCKEFVFYRAKPFDVVINEIMADPEPKNQLPDQEYLELMNTSSYPITLFNWTITVGNNIFNLPAITISPKGHAVLCAGNVTNEFDEFSPVFGIENLSTSSLLNSGTSLVLKDNYNQVIHAVSYDMSWYQDETKNQGGWSLEQIDPENPCAGSENWRASVHNLGGTPALENSVKTHKPDQKSPELLDVITIDSIQIDILFSEYIPDIPSIKPNQIIISNNIGNPKEISYSEDKKTLKLRLEKHLQHDTVYELKLLIDLQDCKGNKLVKKSPLFFTNYTPLEHEIIISEIMANPASNQFLPPFEYIEIYNRKNIPITLKNWKIQLGNILYPLPQSSMAGHEHLIICHANHKDNFSKFGKCISPEGTFSLNNEKGTILLKNQNNDIISGLNYEQKWYKNSNKAKGGWSLELIDPNNVCEGIENWSASTDNHGGTPGRINSVNGFNPDLNKPEITKALLLDSNTLCLFFSEKLAKQNMLNSANYWVNQDLERPEKIDFLNDDKNSLALYFNKPFSKGNIYELHISDSIKDCAGNSLVQNQKIRFGFAQAAEKNDLIINEILFNPKSNGSDFVELYNRSNKIIDLREIQLSNIDPISKEITEACYLDTTGLLMFPGDYLAFSDNLENIKLNYPGTHSDNLRVIGNMPAFNNEQGIVAINKFNEELIDAFNYNESMHFQLLQNKEGVSLERINPDNKTQDSNNWHSASKNSGFATPGYINSQLVNNANAVAEIEMPKKIFSPNNDGIDDFVVILYVIKNGGTVANVAVYDINGQIVKNLIRNELLGTTGSFIWDGLSNTTAQSPVGNYIIEVELFDLKGNSSKYKLNCVLADKI